VRDRLDFSARGQGVGAALMTEEKTWARAHGACKLGWQVWHRNLAAKAFYERLGAAIDKEAVPYVLQLKDEER
jgi:GNAT superfamily N-acetyltransferase